VGVTFPRVTIDAKVLRVAGEHPAALFLCRRSHMFNALIRCYDQAGVETDIEYLHVKIDADHAEQLLEIIRFWHECNRRRGRGDEYFGDLTVMYFQQISVIQDWYSYSTISEHVVEDPDEEFYDLNEHSGIENAEASEETDSDRLGVFNGRIWWETFGVHSGYQTHSESISVKDLDEALLDSPKHLMLAIASGYDTLQITV
jgi:hypothetical protein